MSCAAFPFSALFDLFFNAPCRIATNRSIAAGTGLQASIGLACIGNCASSNASCTGSCTEVVGNSSVTGSDGRVVAHGLITHSSPRIARNTFGGDTTNCTTNGGGPGPFLYGLRLEGSSSRVENNLVMGGRCPSVTAIEQVNAQRSDLSVPAPDVHSNTLVPVALTSGSIMSQLIVGVALRSVLPATALSLPRGTYRNNIITAFGLANLRAVFLESDATTDPAVIEHNNFWSPSIVGMPPLYVNEGNTTLNSAGQINGLNGGGVSSFNNLSNDPGFALNFRLSAGSAMRGAGGATGAPADDIEGDRRPTPANTAPDIGCDEVQ